MSHVYFFTGFPGFLTSRLIKQVVHEEFPIDKIYLFILPSTRKHAQSKIHQLCEELDISHHLFELVEGDITKDNLDLAESTSETLLNSITHAYHLAAIYDLSVPYEPAYNVNVIGTKHVNEWLLQANRLERYTYFSTAYVSGKRTGTIKESDLKHDQGFKNHYESTKYEAELLVQDLKGQLPVTIIRPGIVVGDSQTGQTSKFDGPYFILNLFDRLHFLPTIPYVGKGHAEANFVPVDYVIRASVFLSHHTNSIGKTYHLTDPNPYQSHEVYRMLMEALLGKTPSYRIPLHAAKLPLNLLPVRRWLNIQKQTIPYFMYNSHYDTSLAMSALNGTEIECPDFETVIPQLIHFYRSHKHDEDKKVTIS
ncbi:SDR family oxidoreductase [Pontibacillus sp. HMF3514]|uniref:SDR family oxidoreductase n=1 Tax=Pontibacillus sp. HMF3514 TaxID=2692425 RepID=UPI00131FC80C|nr:SDR family oxidoreductase [Pontibacillus sp. HMF3514]QHE50822.1 NAD-dependent epimerase/dehydratase family protein [Pontibacillus sp. HMF3514]